jgi:enoyl-CoA hydratase
MKVRVEKSDRITTVIINRPECRNAVDRETAQMLVEAFDQFESDAEQYAAVLCGEGEHFCAGFDLKTVGQAQSAYDPEGDGPLGPTRRLLSKPVICAVEGYAVAGGLELTLWCDIRIASETAQFGVFCRRWGVPLIDGGTVRLPRLIGHSRALDMILTGRSVGAGEALNIGLANRVVAAGQARAEAENYAREITRFPQVCLRTDRMSSHLQWGMSLEEALRQEARGGEKPLIEEARRGATRFAGGKGRGGNFIDI